MKPSLHTLQFWDSSDSKNQGIDGLESILFRPFLTPTLSFRQKAKLTGWSQKGRYAVKLELKWTSFRGFHLFSLQYSIFHFIEFSTLAMLKIVTYIIHENQNICSDR